MGTSVVHQVQEHIEGVAGMQGCCCLHWGYCIQVAQAEAEPEAARGLGDWSRTQMGAVAVGALERVIMVLAWTQGQLWHERDLQAWCERDPQLCRIHNGP